MANSKGTKEREKIRNKRNGASRRNGADAYLTVFIALSVPILLSLILTLLTGVRRNEIRMQTELAADTAIRSVLGEYNRQLLDQYDLLFIDTSYCSESAATEKVAAHMQRYLDSNLTSGTDGAGLFGMPRTFTGTRPLSVVIEKTRYAADSNCLALREQIGAYMCADPAEKLVFDTPAFIGRFNQSGLDTGLWESTKAQNDKDLDEAEEKLRREWKEGHEKNTGGKNNGDEGKTPSLDRPCETVDHFRMTPILSQIFGSASKVSGASVNTDVLLSHRDVYTGDGLEADNSHHPAAAGTVMTDMYISQKFGSFTHKREGTRLSYEQEYILFGKGSDRDNLESMALRLLTIRESVNLMYLMSDSRKAAEAETAAMVLAFVTLMPELKDIYKTAIMLAWSYVESVQDLRTLFDGGKVPLFKDGKSWQTSILRITVPQTRTGSGGSGLSYDNYLQTFLFLENERRKDYRIMDLIETNLRQNSPDEHFQMDRCMDTFMVSMSVEGTGGYTCSVIRTVTYN